MNMSLDLDGRILFHVFIVIGSEQDDELSEVYHIGSVVLIGVDERVVHQIVEYETQHKG